MLIDNKLNWMCMCVIDTFKFSLSHPTSVSLTHTQKLFSLFINVAERNYSTEEGVDHTQPPSLINKRQNCVLVFRELSYHGCNLWRAEAYKAITSGAHYFSRSVVISPYDKPGQLLWARDCYIPTIRVLELSLLVCGPC